MEWRRHQKILHDKKAKYIISSALGMDEFFRVTNCKTIKEIWETLEVNNKKDKKNSRRAYIIWKENEYKFWKWRTSTFILHGSHHSDDDDEISNDESYYDELYDAFNDLHAECLKLSRLCFKQKKIISSLESNFKNIQDELDKDTSKLNT